MLWFSYLHPGKFPAHEPGPGRKGGGNKDRAPAGVAGRAPCGKGEGSHPCQWSPRGTRAPGGLLPMEGESGGRGQIPTRRPQAAELQPARRADGAAADAPTRPPAPHPGGEGRECPPRRGPHRRRARPQRASASRTRRTTNPHRGRGRKAANRGAGGAAPRGRGGYRREGNGRARVTRSRGVGDAPRVRWGGRPTAPAAGDRREQGGR